MYINEATRNVKLTLSVFCDKRLETDSAILGIKKSHLIEDIICEYCKHAKQFENVCENEKFDTVHEIILGKKDILFYRTILRLLLEASGRRHFNTKTTPCPWTITSAARDALVDDDLSENESNNFIAEILEEYATMNNASRERIMLRDKIRTIKTAIATGKEISFKLRDKDKRFLPYKIAIEPDSQYIYLIGQTITENGPGTIGSHRIFSMNNISIPPHKTKYIIDSSAIEDYISGRNIAYLWTEETEIEIGLTEKGEQNLELLFNNRPAFKKTDDYLDCEKKFRIYKFTCTEFQAEVYFSSFGKEAKVISPASLVEKMKKFHSEALEVYSE